MPDIVKVGDYVLATKYSDGDPQDPFAIGFVKSIDVENSVRLVREDGTMIYGGRFRRAKKISKERGRFLVLNIDKIEKSAHSVWWWARCKMNTTAPEPGQKGGA